ncbi:hypothetical protein GCM10028787_06160 [Brachybacterium horti]
MEHVPKVLSTAIGDFDRNMVGIGCQRGLLSSLLARREAFAPGTENMAHAVEGIFLAHSNADGHLSDPEAVVIDGRRRRA